MVMAGRVVCLSVVLVFLGSSEEATRPCGLRANLSVNMLHGRQAPANPKFVPRSVTCWMQPHVSYIYIYILLLDWVGKNHD